MQKKYLLFETLFTVNFFLFISLIFVNSKFRIFPEFMIYFYLFYFILRGDLKLFSENFLRFFFILFCIISVGWTVDLEQSIIQIRILIRILLISITLFNYINTTEKYIKLLKSIAISSIVLLFFLFLKTNTSDILSMRLGNNIENINSNTIGMYFAISSIVSFFVFFIERKNIYLGISFINFLPIILSGSRKAILTFIVSFSIIFLLTESNFTKKIKYFFYLLIFLVTTYFLIFEVPLLYDIAGKRIEQLLNSIFLKENFNSTDSISIRETMIKEGFNMIENSLLNGIGVGGYSKLSSFSTYSHNNYVEVLVGTGIVGFIIYIIYYMKLLLGLLSLSLKNYSVRIILIICFILMIMEYGLVTYDEFFYQIIYSLSYILIVKNYLVKWK